MTVSCTCGAALRTYRVTNRPSHFAIEWVSEQTDQPSVDNVYLAHNMTDVLRLLTDRDPEHDVVTNRTDTGYRSPACAQ